MGVDGDKSRREIKGRGEWEVPVQRISKDSQ